MKFTYYQAYCVLRKFIQYLQLSKLLSGFDTLIVSKTVSYVRCNVEPIYGILYVHVKLCTSGKVLICSGVLDRFALREFQGNSYENISVWYRKMKTMCIVL